MSYIDVARRVWRHKWEALITTIGILITLVVETPRMAIFLLWLGLALLLIADIVQAFRKTYHLLREKHLPFIIVAGITDDLFRAMTHDILETMRRWGFDEGTYQNEFDVTRGDWFVRRPRKLPLRRTPWLQLVDDFEGKVNSLAGRLEGKEIFHLFLNCPVVLALAVGAVLKTNYVVVLHHHVSGQYEPVLDFYRSNGSDPSGLTRLTRRAQSPFQYIEVRRPDRLTPRLFVSLSLARHEPGGYIEALAQQQDAASVHVQNTYGDRLQTDDDWIQVAREVITTLLELSADPTVERIDLFLSAPLVLATAIGMGVGTRSAITVHHWFADQQEYRPIFDLEKL